MYICSNNDWCEKAYDIACVYVWRNALHKTCDLMALQKEDLWCIIWRYSSLHNHFLARSDICYTRPWEFYFLYRNTNREGEIEGGQYNRRWNDETRNLNLTSLVFPSQSLKNFWNAQSTWRCSNGCRQHFCQFSSHNETIIWLCKLQTLKMCHTIIKDYNTYIFKNVSVSGYMK
jgi:hypothetical protein